MPKPRPPPPPLPDRCGVVEFGVWGALIMAAMGLGGADFANVLQSRKKFVDDNDDNQQGAVSGQGDGSAGLDLPE